MAAPRAHKPFRPRQYIIGQPWPEDKRSEAQKEAHRRNFGIFQVRGLWALCGYLREPYRSAARALIDQDLAARGAEPEQKRQAERRAADIF